MIRFIDLPTERTTSATDLILAIQTGLMTAFLAGSAALHTFRGWLWIGVFGGMGLTALLGTIAHGFMMSKKTNTVLWQFLTLCFSVCYVLIIGSLAFDLFGPAAGRVAVLVCTGLGLALVLACLRWPAFVPKIIYIGVALGGLMLAAGLWLALVSQQAGAWWLLAGMVLALVATAVEARQKFRLKLIWDFDHHSAYHFWQFLSNFCLFLATTAYFGL